MQKRFSAWTFTLIAAFLLVLSAGCNSDDINDLLNEAGGVSPYQGSWVLNCWFDGSSYIVETLTFSGSTLSFSNINYAGDSTCSTGGSAPTGGSVGFSLEGTKTVTGGLNGITIATRLLLSDGGKTVIQMDTTPNPDQMLIGDETGPLDGQGYPDTMQPNTFPPGGKIRTRL